jgi:hypothetical protein
MTLECVESVLKSDYPSYTIFLIDNGSNTTTDFENLKVLESEKCQVLRIEKNCGYVGGMNHGMKIALGKGYDLFLVMNNDAIIAPDAITKLVECSHKHNHKCITTGKVYHYDRPNVLQFIGYRIVNRKTLKMERLLIDETDNGQWDREMEMDMIDDIFWLFPKKIYEQVGGYSPYFWFNAEQADLALRAVKAGNKLVYTPLAKLWHKGSITIGGKGVNPKLIYYNLQATLIFRYLHTAFGQFIFFYFNTYFKLFLSFVKLVIKSIIGRKTNRKALKAQYEAVLYFNKWVFKKNENLGITPFDYD